MKLLSTMLTAGLFGLSLLSTTVFAAPPSIMKHQEVSEPKIAQAQANLSRLYPQVPFSTPKRSEIPGLLEVSIVGTSDVIYVSNDGKHLISGKVFKIDGAQPVDIVESRNMPIRADLLAKVDLNETLVYPATDNKRARIYVFTDIPCGYSNKLHGQLNQLNEAGVEVVYLAYPRDTQAGRKAYRSMTGFWCESNNKESLDQAFMGQSFAPKDCDAVMNQYTLGSSMGVNSTPHIFFEDGTRVAGALPTAQILAMLGLN